MKSDEAVERTIPVVDIGPFLVDRESRAAATVVGRVGDALRSVGFVVITGHRVDPGLVDRMDAVTRAFFELPAAAKAAFNFADAGYRPSESGSLARSVGAATPPDLCETFRYNPRASSARPPFPSTPSPMGETWTSWFAVMETLAGHVMALLARALGLDDDWFDAYFENHSSTLIANYYPRQGAPPLPGQLRRGAHTDFGVVTILHQSSDDGGLEVCHPLTAEWVPVPHVDSSFVLNVGDLTERWTNGRWKSTFHRVANPDRRLARESARLSLPFFHRPDPEATITVIDTCVDPGESARFEPVNAGEWMDAKQRLIYPADDSDG